MGVFASSLAGTVHPQPDLATMVSPAFAACVFLSSSLLVQAQNSVSDSCSLGESCIGIRSCLSVVEQLQRAKATEDATTRNKIITQVRDKVCGKRKDRKVCCGQDQQPAVLDLAHTKPAVKSAPKKIGTFSNIFHDIGGTAYAVDDKTILIKGFNYDGEGPDAFFLGGTKGRPSKSGEVVMPHPFQGKHFNYRDKDIPILGRFNGDKDIVLNLPPGKTVSELKWISVWCRDYTVNFG